MQAQTASDELFKRLQSKEDIHHPKQKEGPYSGSFSNRINSLGRGSGDADSVVSGAWCRLARYREGQGRVNDATRSYVESLRCRA